ncbi:hypothetical protein JCM5353_009056 [Sporobolomyces roseus]
MSAPLSPPVLNRDPRANPHFLTGLHEAGCLSPWQFGDGPEAIMSRYRGGLEAAQFWQHKSTFCRQNGLRETSETRIDFRRTQPTPNGPYVHIFVEKLPPALDSSTSIGSTEANWTVDDSVHVEKNRVEFAVTIPNFLPSFVVFELGDDESFDQGGVQELSGPQAASINSIDDHKRSSHHRPGVRVFDP